ncbi:MAG: O-antigen ligase family protein [Anaerolineae bacterium]
MPQWLPYFELACVTAAGALWYIFPEAGPWPLILALPPWLARLVWSGQLTRRTPFDLPLLLFLLTAGVGVWAAYDRTVAWRKFWLLLGAVLIFYALANAQALGEARSWLLAAFGAGVALYSLATQDWQAYEVKIQVLYRLGRALQAPLPSWSGHRMNPNVAASVLALMLPFGGLVTLQAWRQVRQAGPLRPRARWLRLIVATGLLALILFALLMTVSRAAWLAVAAALVVVGLWAMAGRLGQASGSSRAAALFVLLGLGLILLLAVGLFWPQTIAAALTSLPANSIASGRLELLQRTVTLLGDYPLMGAGLGGFQMLYSTYALLLHVGYAWHSHNLFFDVALEQGFPGLLALVSMWLVFAWIAWRALSQREQHRAPGALAAAVVSLLILLLHGLVDDPLYSGRGVLLFFVPLAFAASVPIRRPARRRRPLALPAALLVLLLLALLGRDPLLSLAFSNLGAIHQSQAELSVYAWPEWPVQDEVRRTVNLSEPVAEFERALAFNPRNGTANRRLGMIDLALGRYPAALQHLEAAYAVESKSMTTRQLFGEALIVNGRVEEGRALWEDVSNDENQLGIRAWWYGYIGETERAEWIEQAASDHR